MALVYIEEIPIELDGKFSTQKTSLRCHFCRAIFPIEYGECPSCNMLK